MEADNRSVGTEQDLLFLTAVAHQKETAKHKTVDINKKKLLNVVSYLSEYVLPLILIIILISA